MPDDDDSIPFDVPGWAIGDALDLARQLPDNSIDCIVTSPPYWGLRSYLPDDHPDKAREMGAEPTLAEYVERLVTLFRELRRALRPEGTCWLNLGDSYTGSASSGGVNRNDGGPAVRVTAPVVKRAPDLKPKDLCLVPYRVALALQVDGWWLRDNIVWHKPNPMPASVTDRCTSAHEAVFLLTKSARYWFDADAIKEPAATDDRPRSTWVERKKVEPVRRGDPGQSGHRTTTATLASGTGRNKRNVWTIATKPYSGSHYAVMPPALVEPCIKAGCPAGGVVLDPFGGSGTVAEVAESLGRRWLLFDIDHRNVRLIQRRTSQRSLLGLIE